MNKDSLELTKKICGLLSERKAEDIMYLDISELTVVAESFVIASGRSAVQVKAACDFLEEKLNAEGVRPARIDGYNEGRWIVLGLHWVFFYGSIKASNVSIGVVCFSLVGFFTAFLEPLINCHRVSFKEVVFSLLTLFGVVLIFHFDTRYRLGIGLGIISSALAALFTITNKKIGNNYSTSTMLLYEMVGGFIGLSCILPFYLRYFPVSTIVPGLLDFTYLLLLASVCTIGLYLLQIQVLKKISAFTVNLSYNLEPIYSIILAMLLFSEAKELNAAFYIGLGVIILSVILQTLSVIRSNKKI